MEVENIEIYVDGGLLKKNMYIGVLSNCERFPIRLSKKLGKGTVHKAEEEAIYACVDILKENPSNEEIIIYTDLIAIATMLKKKITPKHLKSFPKMLEIQSFIKENNIKVKWIKSSSNIAHNLVALAQNEHLFNDIKPKEVEDKSILNNDYNYIESLNAEIIKKDNLIKDLSIMVVKLNTSFQNQ